MEIRVFLSKKLVLRLQQVNTNLNFGRKDLQQYFDREFFPQISMIKTQAEKLRGIIQVIKRESQRSPAITKLSLQLFHALLDFSNYGTSIDSLKNIVKYKFCKFFCESKDKDFLAFRRIIVNFDSIHLQPHFSSRPQSSQLIKQQRSSWNKFDESSGNVNSSSEKRKIQALENQKAILTAEIMQRSIGEEKMRAKIEQLEKENLVLKTALRQLKQLQVTAHTKSDGIYGTIDKLLS